VLGNEKSQGRGVEQEEDAKSSRIATFIIPMGIEVEEEDNSMLGVIVWHGVYIDLPRT
jgi:hypothetical protein